MIENTKCTNVMSGHILHESVMVSYHESGMFFVPSFAFAFFESFFTIFGALMHECFVSHACFIVFLQRVYVLNLWSKNGSING